MRHILFTFKIFHFDFCILIFALLFVVVPTAIQAQLDFPILTIDLSAAQTEIDSEIEARILVSSQEPVNAFDIVLEYPTERLEFIRASAAGSIVSVWQSLPLANEQSGSLRLVGGMVSPFSGEDGQIITLIFRAKAFGDVAFAVPKADFALADGKGTSVFATIVSRESLPVRTGSETASPPKIVEAAIAQDPLTKTPIVAVKTEDDGGVREVQMRTRQWFWWSDWQKTGFITEVPKYAWTAQIAAIGWDWQWSETTIYRWNIAALKLLLILVVFVIVGYGTRRIFQKLATE